MTAHVRNTLRQYVCFLLKAQRTRRFFNVIQNQVAQRFPFVAGSDKIRKTPPFCDRPLLSPKDELRISEAIMLRKTISRPPYFIKKNGLRFKEASFFSYRIGRTSIDEESTARGILLHRVTLLSFETPQRREPVRTR